MTFVKADIKSSSHADMGCCYHFLIDCLDVKVVFKFLPYGLGYEY